MKLPEKKKQKIKKKSISKPKKEKVLVVAQEFKFARLLSGNEKKTRDRVLKTLKRWLMNCFEKGYEFKEDDFIRVWKGLFYAVWMSDKPLVQEDLCESIAEILDLFPPEQVSGAMLMTKAGFKVLATEWYGIDQHRMDKFLMLVRRYLRGSLRCLLRCDWSLSSCELFCQMLSNNDGLLAPNTPLYARNSLSMVLHIMDCYLEEISKVSNGEIPEESLSTLLRPFCSLVVSAGGERSTAARRVLTALLRQSTLGLQYDSKARAWQKMGCPVGGPDALELVSDDDDDDDEEHPDESMTEDRPPALDPRAGRVSVSLAPLPVPAQQLAVLLRGLLRGASSACYRRARICAERFEELARNKYPLKVPESDTLGREPNLHPAEPQRAAQRLQSLEKNLLTASDELAMRGLSRKHRKRLLARSRAGLSIVDEERVQTESTNGDWLVETTESDIKKNESDKENKDAKTKKRKRKHQKEDTTKEKTLQMNKKQKVNKNEINIENDKSKNNKSPVNGNDSKVNDTLKDRNLIKINKNVSKDKNVVNNKNKLNKKTVINDKENKEISENAKTDNKQYKQNKVNKIDENKKTLIMKKDKQKTQPKLVVNKVKNYQKQVNSNTSPKKSVMETPKKVKFVLKNNSMQGPVEYYKSVRQSPNIPFDSSKKPSKTNLKPSTPSPINPFFKKKFKLRN